MLFECALVSASLCGMLSVYEGVIFLSILVGMCKGNLYILAFEVYDRIYTIIGHGIIEQVLESVSAHYPPAVIHDGKSSIEVCIIAEHCFHYVVMKRIVGKQRVVGFEIDECSVFVLCIFGILMLQYTLFECGHPNLSVAV